ncbi:FG-GAP repeat domain-containing protein [Ilyomonas limi]|nr:VCBS repeat-containing protein [Ilyomonas limi]
MKKKLPVISLTLIIFCISCKKDNVQIQSNNLKETGTAAIQADGFITTWLASYGATTKWKTLQTSEKLNDLSNLAFGIFRTNNKKTDVLQTETGEFWKVSHDGTSQLATLNTQIKITADKLLIGDFDGNGKSDVFYADGIAKTWYVSFNGSGSWTVINTASEDYTKLKLGDFDGDGKADVFYANGITKTWYVSYGGKTKWRVINTASEDYTKLALGDFDGNGKTDVFYTDGATWYISDDGVKSWRKVNTAKLPLSKLGFGDFNGDGKTDVFYAKRTYWTE